MLIKTLLSKTKVFACANVDSILNLNQRLQAYNKGAFAYYQVQRTFADRRFSKKHEWVSFDLKQSKVGTVGISQYAQEALGDVVYVQLPDVDTSFDQNEEVGAVESVKAASEIYTPVSGKVVQVNSLLEEKPGLVNSSCYDKGWLYQIEMTKVEEVEQLMNEDDYKNYLKSIRED